MQQIVRQRRDCSNIPSLSRYRIIISWIRSCIVESEGHMVTLRRPFLVDLLEATLGGVLDRLFAIWLCWMCNVYTLVLLMNWLHTLQKIGFRNIRKLIVIFEIESKGSSLISCTCVEGHFYLRLPPFPLTLILPFACLMWPFAGSGHRLNCQSFAWL